MILILSMFLSLFSAEREWFLNNVSYGSARDVAKPTMYQKGTAEYKILQLALDIESVLPTKLYDTDYQKKFMELIPVPKSMHANFKKRQSIYSDIKTLEKHRYIREQKGFLVPHGAVTEKSRKLINKENTNRKELYSLIASHLAIKKDDIIKKIPEIYGNAITNLKYYIMLTREPSITGSDDVLASMTTSYSLGVVSTKLKKFLLKNNYKQEALKESKNHLEMDISFSHCQNKKPVFFRLTICKVLKSKALCNKKIAKGLLEGLLVDNGTLIWVERYPSSKPTIFISSDKTEDKDVMLCAGKKFSFFDDLSQYLIKE